MFFDMRWLQLVGFGEDHRKWTLDLAEPLQKFEIDFLGFVARIDQYEDAAQVWPVGDVAGYDILKRDAMTLRHLGVAITRQIHHAEGSVDFEKIDELGATGPWGDVAEGLEILVFQIGWPSSLREYLTTRVKRVVIRLNLRFSEKIFHFYDISPNPPVVP